MPPLHPLPQDTGICKQMEGDTSDSADRWWLAVWLDRINVAKIKLPKSQNASLKN